MAEGSSDSLVKDAIVSVLYDTSGPQVNVKGISQDLVRENVIDGNLEQHILSQQTDSDSQHILAQRLYNYGTLESVKRLCRVLRRTVNRYHSHASVAEKLEEVCGFTSLTAHSHEKRVSHTPGELHDSEMSEEKIIEVFRRGSLPLKKYYEKLPPVPFKPYLPTLDYIELAVIDRGEERIKNESQVNTFLHAAMLGIDAIHQRLKSIEYAEILEFDEKRPTTGRRIVISGAPGCGKSTLSRQLCKDLSSGTLRNTYQLVILVELRELVYRLKVGEQLGLKHLLMKYPSLNSKKVFDALQCGYLKHVLFILDGYDELDESLRSCQFLRDILSPSNPSLFLSECDVVITTRPVTSGELFELVKNPYRNVEILGFTEEHIRVYIDKYFENLENGQMKATKLKEKLEQLPHVRGMCRVPIVLEFVCKVHRLLGDQGIPDTQTGIYGTYIVAELFNSKPHWRVSVQDLLIVSEEDFPGFHELCCKAFECCSSTNGQRLLLTEQDVGNLTRYHDRGSIYGLLFAEVVESVCGSVRLFHYLHKGIQEMLAAVHIAILPDDKHAPLWREQFGRPEMAEIWKYYAGITELKKLDTNTLLDIFRKIGKDQEIILMLSLYEANNQGVAKKVLPVMFSENKISITVRSSYEIVAANYCIKHHPSLASFELKLIGRRPAIKFGETLKNTACQISNHPTLKSLKCSGFKEEDWTLFSDGLVPFKSVSTFAIDDSMSTILSSIAKNSFDLPDLTLIYRDGLQGNTPVDEKGLCEAWSQCKCKTVTIRLPDDLTQRGASLILSVLKGISVNGQVQHLVFDDPYSPLRLHGLPKQRLSTTKGARRIFQHGNHEERRDWLSLLKQLLVLRLTCRLSLRLSPAEWAAILCGVGGAKQLEELNVAMEFTHDNTPVDEKELCEAWSQCKCETVKMKIEYPPNLSQSGASLARSVLKGISVNGHVQHLVFQNLNSSLRLHGSHEENRDWLSLKLLLVPRLTCQLTLSLSPAEWAAILCGVEGAEQLEELDVTMWFTNGNTPVDEKELCEAWSQCKCKTVKMEIDYSSAKTPQGVSLLTGVLRGIAQNKTSVEFTLGFQYSVHQSYYMEWIPKDILTHFTRDGQTLTLNPLNSRCPTGGVSSGESPETPGSNPTGESSNKRRHIEQPPLVGVTESTSSSPAQQVDHASHTVHSTQSYSSRSSPMSQRASLPQSPISSVVDPSSLVTVPMETSRPDMSPSSTHSHTSAHHSGDSPQPPYTLQRTHPIDHQYDDYEEALKKHGSVSVEVTRTLFTGPAGVGKSSLKHLLIKGHSKEIDSSTQLMEKPEILIFSEHYSHCGRMDKENPESSSWTFVSDSSLSEALRLCAQQKDYQERTQNPALNHTEVNPSKPNVEVESEHKSTSPSEAKVSYTSSEVNPSLSSETQTELVNKAPSTDVISQGNIVHSKSLADDIIQGDPTTIELLDRARSNLLKGTSREDEPIIKLKEAKFLHVIDSGGQPVFQDILPLLLAIPCTYIQVFDASKALDDPISSTLRQQDGRQYDLQHSGPCESQWEFIQSSLSSMHTMDYKFPSEYFRAIIKNIPKFRVIFVGTFKDKVKELREKCTIVNEKITSLKGKPYYERFQGGPEQNRFFFIDNHMTFKGHRSYLEEGGHFHLEELRKLISDERGRFKLDVPLMWFQVELITRQFENKFIEEDELKTFCLKRRYIDEAKADEEFRCLLKLFHVLGFYVHFDLDSSCLTDGVNYVCTDPTVLYKEIAKLLTVQYLPTNECANMDIFLTEGMISPDLCSTLCPSIDSLWLLEVLHELGIAAKLKPVNSPLYFLPYVLPYRRAKILPYSSVEPLCVTFAFRQGMRIYCNLPRGVFCCLVVKLCNIWDLMPEKSDRKTMMFFKTNTYICLKEEPSHLSCQIVINNKSFSYSPMDEQSKSKLQEIQCHCSGIRTQLVTHLQEIATKLFGEEFKKIAQCTPFQTCSCKQITNFLQPEIGGIKVITCSKPACSSKLRPLQTVWFEPVDSTKVEVSTVEENGHSFLKLLEKDNQALTGPSLKKTRTIYSQVTAADVVQHIGKEEFIKELKRMLTDHRTTLLETRDLINSDCRYSIQAKLTHGQHAEAVTELVEYFVDNHDGDKMMEMCTFLKEQAGNTAPMLVHLANTIKYWVKLLSESTSFSPAQQVDHASHNVHSTQSDSSRSSPMSQRASLPQGPISSVVDPSSLVTVHMQTSRPDMSPSSTHSHTSAHHIGDSPQPPSTCQRTHPIDPQYSESVCLNVMYSSTPYERHPGKPTLPLQDWFCQSPMHST